MDQDAFGHVLDMCNLNPRNAKSYCDHCDHDKQLSLVCPPETTAHIGKGYRNRKRSGNKCNEP